MLVFRKILRTYLMDGSLIQCYPHRHYINLFLANDPFSYPSDDAFRGYKNRTLTRDGLNVIKIITNERSDIK